MGSALARVDVDLQPDAVVVSGAGGSPDRVASRVAATVVDLYPFVPDASSDVILTSHSDDLGDSPLDPLARSTDLPVP